MKLYKCNNCELMFKDDSVGIICPRCNSDNIQLQDNLKKLKQEKVKNRIKRKLQTEKVTILRSNVSISKDKRKCIDCGMCAKICQEQGIFNTFTDLSTPVCINCGKCTLSCPTYSLTEKFSFRKVRDLLGKKIMAISIAPAVKVSLCEEFNVDISEKQMVSALKKLGFNYVFDICTGADFTIMEEAKEFCNRLQENKLPMFTSCCPSWVKFAEIYFPEILNNLSTTKSPISIQSALVKTYVKEKLNVEDIIHVVVAPCTAKKFEISRKELVPTTDYILTTRELAHLLKIQNIDIINAGESEYNSPLNLSSSSAEKFGISGGVSSSVLKTAYYLQNKQTPPKEYDELINNNSKSIISLPFGKSNIRAMKVYGINEIKNILPKIINNSLQVDFIEVMACDNGCVGGGGQPKKENHLKRFDNLKEKSKINIVKETYDSPVLNEIYKDLYLKQKTDINYIKTLLHTTYKSRQKKYILK